MIRTTLLSLGASALLATSVTAQCTDNFYRLTLTNSSGTPAPITTIGGESYYQFQTEAVYLAFDPRLPTGTYYVHVTDQPDGIGDRVLSTNDPSERFIHVNNPGGAGNISLSYAFSSNPLVTGTGLNGIGQSLRLSSFTTSPIEPCRFKAWFGNDWSLTNGPTNPFLLDGGLHPTTSGCAVRSYERFVLGTGNGSDVAGDVFLDGDRDGIRDPGESGLSGWQVRLVSGATTLTATTNASGRYLFADVLAGNYTVELVTQPTFVTTTAGSFAIRSCGCADVTVGAFGVAPGMLACEARTIGYWSNRHGLQRVDNFGILATLCALGLVDASGNRVALTSQSRYRDWLRCANSTNMAYMLSAQLVAMHNNVLVGFVDPNCVINDPSLGQLSIAQLMQQAALSLWAHPNTRSSGPRRAAQEKLKNALDRANNNQIWR